MTVKTQHKNGGTARLLALALSLSIFAAGSVPAPALSAPDNVLRQFIIDPVELGKGGKSFLTSDAKIPCMSWVDKKPVAIVLAIHGFGLHKGTYDSFSRDLAAMGVGVYAIDVRGFGSWVKKGVNRIDFDGTMSDIAVTLKYIRKAHPKLPIIVLGESMGGAIAMKAASQYPDLVDGLISSVPAGDRFDQADSELGIVKHVLVHGMNAPLDVGPSVVGAATKKQGLREAWLSDPLARTMVTPAELVEFNKFMNKTFDYAPKIKAMPVLFIQGSKDKLVRPAGTWKLFNRINSPHKQFVLSTTAEHLIFEGGQFSDEDLSFIASWIDGSVVDILPDKQKVKEAMTAEADTNGAGASSNGADGAGTGTGTGTTGTGAGTGAATTTASGTTGTGTAGTAGSTGSTAIASATTPADTRERKKTSLSYWIELKRGGKTYRCNNKMSFQSGDAIRFHVIPEIDGYAYVVLQQGSTGSSAILFPVKGQNNYLRQGTDYPLPYDDWLAFDANPGLEKVRIMFSRTPVSETKLKNQGTKVAYVSADSSGAKDLIGTGLQLSWDDPTPVIMPDEIDRSTRLADSSRGSQVHLSFDQADGALAFDVALLHQ
ncbi:MAG: alpha/beta fold hydrolase [Candidatus Melainabacteria bacterium]|nr:alpha/beta fold hydrolase [Candidatus Melainabacteria bacterium]